MHIFIDETKKLAEWKIIFWWFLTTHKSSSIDKFYQEFLKENWIKETGWEIKSYDKKYRNKIPKIFLKISQRKELNYKAFWLEINWYKENLKNYTKAVEKIIELLALDLIKHKGKIKIIADSVKLWTKNKSVIFISKTLSKRFNLKCSFSFENSKNYWGLKIADFICGELRAAKLLGRFSKELNPNLKKTLIYKEKEDMRSDAS